MTKFDLEGMIERADPEGDDGGRDMLPEMRHCTADPHRVRTGNRHAGLIGRPEPRIVRRPVDEVENVWEVLVAHPADRRPAADPIGVGGGAVPLGEVLLVGAEDAEQPVPIPKLPAKVADESLGSGPVPASRHVIRYRGASIRAGRSVAGYGYRMRSWAPPVVAITVAALFLLGAVGAAGVLIVEPAAAPASPEATATTLATAAPATNASRSWIVDPPSPVGVFCALLPVWVVEAFGPGCGYTTVQQWKTWAGQTELASLANLLILAGNSFNETAAEVANLNAKIGRAHV